MKTLFQNKAVRFAPLHKFFFGQPLSIVWQSGYSGYGHIKMRSHKNSLFHGEEKTYKNGQKGIKNGLNFYMDFEFM